MIGSGAMNAQEIAHGKLIIDVIPEEVI